MEVGGWLVSIIPIGHYTEGGVNCQNFGFGQSQIDLGSLNPKMGSLLSRSDCPKFRSKLTNSLDIKEEEATDSYIAPVC